jgi:hypothetical protein
MEPTTGTQKRTNACLVGANQACRNALHFTAAISSVRNSSRAAITSSADNLRRGRTNKSKPATSSWCRLKVSRTRRLRKLRSTADRATRLPTTRPKRANGRPLGAACTRKRSPRELRRERRRLLNASSPDRRARRGNASDRKPLAALGAAIVQDRPAAQRFHAGAKPMRPRAANFRWLIGAFHCRFRNGREKPAITRRRGHHCQLLCRRGSVLDSTRDSASGLWITCSAAGTIDLQLEC